MRNRISVLALFLSLAVAHSASAHESVNADQILESANPAALVQAKIAEARSLYLRAEFALQNFDAALDRLNDGDKFSLSNSPEYLDLLALRQLRHESEDDLVATYEALAERTDPVAFPRDSAVAEQALAAFQWEVFAKNAPVDQMILADLKNQLPALAEAAPAADWAKIVPAVRPFLQQEGKIEFAKQDDLTRRFAEVRTALAPRVQMMSVVGMPGVNLTGSTFPNNTWAITYDDGPSKFTLQNLANLQALGVKATFFWLAKNVKANPQIVNKVKAAGMALANHSYTHAQLTKLGASGLQREIVDSTNVEAQFYGYRPKFFRLPYGAGVNNATIRRMIAEQGMKHVFWNVDSLDWQDKNAASVFARTKKQMNAQKRGIILFHDIHPQTVGASRMTMEYGKQNGAHFVTMPQIAP